jgi:hypothetical protein
MAAAVYSMSAIASMACAWLLFRAFWRYRRRASRLVLWSSVSFVWFAVSNALVFMDLVILPTEQLAVARATTACIGSALLLFGLIWETD